MEFNAKRISVISTRIQNYFNIGMLWSYVWGSHVSVLFRIAEMIFRKHLRRKMPESQTLKVKIKHTKFVPKYSDVPLFHNIAHAI